MQAQLHVKNFGPIKEVNLDLRNVNVFIGPQASGKSALAKIYTICKSPLSFFEYYDPIFNSSNSIDSKKEDANVANFKETLDEYNIRSFLRNDTLIDFDSELHHFRYENENIIYDRKFLERINLLDEKSKDIDLNYDYIKEHLVQFYDSFLFFQLSLDTVLKEQNFALFDAEEFKEFISKNILTADQLEAIIDKVKELETKLSTNKALYIPSERSFIPIIVGATLNLLNNNVPIPKHILQFGAEFEKAKDQDVDLNFLKNGLKYKYENGASIIYFNPDQSIKLTEAASGLQSVIPLLLPILSKRNKSKIEHNSFVIEEPELNLFPKAQYELIKILEEGRFDTLFDIQDIGTIQTYTTHSPYILSAFNNLLYADKVKNLIQSKLYDTSKDWGQSTTSAKELISKILPTTIDATKFNAYQISDGSATSIFKSETGLIDNNFIDESSDEMSDDFEALMELMQEYEK